jgi:hypothetical protein
MHDDQAWRLPENAESHSSAVIRVHLTESNTLDDLMVPIFADLCCCTAEVLARVLRFNAIEGVQEGAEKPLAGQNIDGAMATLNTDLPLTSDLGIWRKPRIHSGYIGVFQD